MGSYILCMGPWDRIAPAGLPVLGPPALACSGSVTDRPAIFLGQQHGRELEKFPVQAAEWAFHFNGFAGLDLVLGEDFAGKIATRGWSPRTRSWRLAAAVRGC